MAERLYDAEWLKETMERFAEAALGEEGAPGEWVLAGVRTRGANLAERLAGELSRRGHEVLRSSLGWGPPICWMGVLRKPTRPTGVWQMCSQTARSITHVLPTSAGSLADSRRS